MSCGVSLKRMNAFFELQSNNSFNSLEKVFPNDMIENLISINQSKDPKLLIVNDEPFQLLTLKMLIQSHKENLEIVTAINGDQAVRYI